MALPGKPIRIFIVEDNDPDVFLVEEALRSQGIRAEIERCYDGEEAIHAVSKIGAERLPDIVIVDLNLPKVPGLEILKHLRGLKHFDSVPVLVLTSSQSTADRARSLDLGANAYIAKPPTLPEFLAAVGGGVRSLLEGAGRSLAERAGLRAAGCYPRRIHGRIRRSQTAISHGFRAAAPALRRRFRRTRLARLRMAAACSATP